MFGTDIRETDEKYLVCFTLGDINEEDLVITFEDGTLRVQADSISTTADVGENVEVDIKRRVVDKSTVLGPDADGSKITHVYFAGFLEVTVPKRS